MNKTILVLGLGISITSFAYSAEQKNKVICAGIASHSDIDWLNREIAKAEETGYVQITPLPSSIGGATGGARVCVLATKH